MGTVLVVDDSAVDRSLIGALLERGHELRVEYATDGREGLERVRASPPDLVVTDLQMPEMNGLQLVAKLQQEFPRIPIVLVTAEGSEKIAVQALQEGASSYVPKGMLAEELGPTVDHVMDVAAKARDQYRVFGHLRRNDLVFELENDETLFPPLVHYLQDMLLQTGVCDDAQNLQVGVALDEALSNSLYHGNLEVPSSLREDDPHEFFRMAGDRKGLKPYRDRRIQVEFQISPERARITLRDGGPGFDYRSLANPSDPENIMKVSGRGVFLMRTFMDEVEYNDAGNEVTMVKLRNGKTVL